MTPEPVVDVRGLRMEYSGRTVLDDIDLRIDRGEVVALLGPNGAGKTTTIEILEGFRQRVGGEVSVLGENPERAGDAWRAKVGVVLQSWRDHGRWRVGQLLQQFGAMYEPYATSDRPGPYPAAELLELVGLAAHRDAQVRSLSGGQRRRLDVAIGIVGRPELLFLDEPTSGFDPVARHEFHELIHRLSDFDETTVLLTTHDLAEAEKIAGRILILDGGRIVANGSAAELAGEVAGASEITWREDGVRHVHSAADPVPFVRELLDRPGTDITELQVRAQTLEETYLAMVARSEAVPVGDPQGEVQTA
ncbi:ABC transporter ATP-binding protein [Agromyces sp. SYSU K20354]|uniref:ABC transporter ATP-binding protein n=1 Tax=Agromyces cavernae TaxID=2898659 RepID=UPI001E5F62CE|nr:ABC transporter ATP-binding protein [Agromyces cavernae]MCD2441724.1 ABC transporter ATP-binding protein [Agromyces cavernae]